VQIGRFFGVPVYLSASWLLIAVFMTIAFEDVFRTNVDGASAGTAYALAAAFAVLSALCVLVHELGHVAMALLLGLQVRRVFVYLLGGVSEIDPEPQRAGQEFAVSAAGPVASALIGGIAWAGYSFSPAGSAIGVELEILAWSNLAIAVFNALPGLPLDGGRVLRATIWGASRSRVRGTIVAAWGGRVVAVGVAASGLLVTEGRWQVIATIFTAGMGAFLWFAAGHAITAARLTDRLPDVSAASLVRSAIYVAAATPVSEALRRLWSDGARAIVVVDGSDRPYAIVSEAMVNRLDQSTRDWTTVAEVAVPIADAPRLATTLRGRELLDVVATHPVPDYLVEIGGHPIGVLSASDLRIALTDGLPSSPVGRRSDQNNSTAANGE
jgi:Zn-dependent protease/CBS domain-containing protein